ncbi:FAD-binding dehydrogenase [Alkalibacillus almallahensis]|uniref:FAD-binding dehydrogenase n=1 Tax=Alkalibacillus almallahensis TaxID=1379154 RepID=UPI00141FD1B7|nr:FAD-binding dehydrogenase [Alkalibacillus almallahensis]NIK10987.1 hypothetical protein [Alkalibacillus almallahensis]
MKYDAIVIGAGLSGLVATSGIAAYGKHVLLLDQEPESSFGGQAWWSFGGLFLIDSPEQRRVGIRDSYELARQDWLGSAAFDQGEHDYWGKQWAEAYLDFAANEKRQWLKNLGISFFPVIGWAERGGYLADGHGNSVPRFHIVWGTGAGILDPFKKLVSKYIDGGLVTYLPRHQVNSLLKENNAVVGVEGSVLVDDESERGEKSSREIKDAFHYKTDHVVIATGGIGANFKLIRENWPERLGPPPKQMISGVPDHVDGQMIQKAEESGANVVNKDRMWHYTEGIKNYDPVWSNHGIRILPGPSSLWLDAEGNRLPSPNFPGFDTLGTLESIMKTGYDYSWFILTQSLIEKEFALSGSEQNPDLTGKSIKKVLKRALPGAPGPVEAFKEQGEDFVVADNLSELVTEMNQLSGENLLDEQHILSQIEARDREMDNQFTKDLQITALRGSRFYKGDKLIRTAKPHKLFDAKHGPLIAVRLNILSRKTLGGLQTNLSGQVLNQQGKPITGLYAAGEASGFGGGGIHGYRALEGTFLGGCLFTGRIVGKTIGKS